MMTEARSPWQEAWGRLRKNRAAVAGSGWIVAMLGAGFGAPWLAEYAVGLSPEEQHTALAYAPPGVVDVSFDFPSYDATAGTFADVDTDGDGKVTCHIEKLALDDAGARRLLVGALGPGDSNWPTAARVPLAPFLAAWAGRVVCPELVALQRVERHWAFLTERFDRATGMAAPLPELRQPDGKVSRMEYPQTAAAFADTELAQVVADLGLLGDAGLRRADADGDGFVTRAEAILQTRRSRYHTEHLLAAHDANRNLELEPSEFPGLPTVRTFWLGTDQKGRDLLVRLLHGARISLAVGLLGAAVALLIGISYGAIAGYAGGRLDNAMMRAVDVLYGLPFMFIVILLLVVAGRSTINLFIALGAVSWLSMARIVRGQVLAVRRREFVEAAEAMGVGRARILLRHVLPNTLGPVVVYATLSVPAIVLEEAFLSFLGLGVQPPAASWGTLISEGVRVMTEQPWLILYPAAALGLTVMALNFLGDGLRDALDPRSAR